MTNLPTPHDIKAAAKRLAGFVQHTPVLTCEELNAQTGGRIFLKAECLQETGSFKFRGAMNKLLQLSEDEKAAGVVAWSTGNHAQGVAAAAQALGVSAKIVMPADAPKAKLDGTRAHGADIVFYDRVTEDREGIGHRIAAEEGRIIVPPYDDAAIISGQGTAGLELADHVTGQGLALDDVLVPVSGGGLLAGVGLAVKDRFPGVSVYAVEPENFDDHRLSLESGRRHTNAKRTGSICDALLAPTPGALTWQINRGQLAGGYAVRESDVLDAMAFAHRIFNIRLEPGGAIALAAVRGGYHKTKDRCVGVILSGGNVDDDVFNRALGHATTT